MYTIQLINVIPIPVTVQFKFVRFPVEDFLITLHFINVMVTPVLILNDFIYSIDIYLIYIDYIILYNLSFYLLIHVYIYTIH